MIKASVSVLFLSVLPIAKRGNKKVATPKKKKEAGKKADAAKKVKKGEVPPLTKSNSKIKVWQKDPFLESRLIRLLFWIYVLIVTL